MTFEYNAADPGGDYWQRAYEAAKARAERAEAALAARTEARRKPEVRLNDDKTLDEVVTDGFQLEQLDYNHWFLSVEGGDKGVAVWLYSHSRIRATYEWRDCAPVSPQQEKTE